MTKHIDEFAEIEAMKAVANAIKDLDDNERNRVLAWATGKYYVKSKGESGMDTPDIPLANSFPGERQEGATATDLPATFAAASPDSGTDKALVVAYWRPSKAKQMSTRMKSIMS